MLLVKYMVPGLSKEIDDNTLCLSVQRKEYSEFLKNASHSEMLNKALS